VWAAGSAGDASDWAGGTGCPSAWFAGSSGWGGGAGGLVDLKLTETAVDGELDTGLVAGEVGDGIGTHSQHFFAFAGGAEDFVEVLEEQEEIFGILVKQDVFVGALAMREAIAPGCGLCLRRCGPVDFRAFTHCVDEASVRVGGSLVFVICLLAGVGGAILSLTYYWLRVWGCGGVPCR
jgi:hypothetical protein